MTKWLRLEGPPVNAKRTRRLMRQMGLEAVYPRRKRGLSVPDTHHKIYPYLLKDVAITRPDQVWSADITYIRMYRGWLYLTAVMDWFSRYVLSWEVSITLESDFCVSALQAALSQGQPEIFNTDQGSQFTSVEFTGTLRKAGVQISMDGKGRAFDNIFIERLWRTVKVEEVYLRDYQTIAEARYYLGRYFAFYNKERLRQALGYRSPAVVYGVAVGTPVALRAPSVPTAALTGDESTLKQPIFCLDNGEGFSDMFSKYQFSKVKANAITAQHYNDQVSSLNKFMSFLGQSRRIKEISTLDLQNYKRKLEKQYTISNHRLNLHISNLKTLFHWATKNDILKQIPNIDAVSRSKIINKQRRIFTHEEISKLLSVADAKMKAMIWLGLNCGFGCTDCSELQWKHLDLDNDRVIYPRGKTGVPRNLPLWPETIEALRAVPKKGKLVFYTTRGNPFVRNVVKIDTNGHEKYCPINTIATKFSRMMEKAGLDVPKGTGFYTLRRTAATIAARSGDPFAVQRLLGHANLLMATRYVQDVSKQTDEVIGKSRMYVV